MKLMHAQTTRLKLKQPNIIGSPAPNTDNASTVKHSINITFLLCLLYWKGMKTVQKRSQTNTNMSQLRSCKVNTIIPPLILHVSNPNNHCPLIVEIIATGRNVSANKESMIATCKAKKKVVCCRCLNLMMRKMISPVRLN